MKLWLVLLLALSLAPAAEANAVRGTREQARIEYLIATVAGLKDAVFVRNGRDYDAGRAADHLRKKLDYAEGKVQTAEDFIDRCATASWLSRSKYRIRFGDGRVLDSAAFLRAKLKGFDGRRTRLSGDQIAPAE